MLTTGSDRKITYWETFDGQAIRMLDGSDEGEVNALAITKFNHQIYQLGKVNISYLEVKIKRTSFGDMMKVFAISLEPVTLALSQEYYFFLHLIRFPLVLIRNQLFQLEGKVPYLYGGCLMKYRKLKLIMIYLQYRNLINKKENKSNKVKKVLQPKYN